VAYPGCILPSYYLRRSAGLVVGTQALLPRGSGRPSITHVPREVPIKAYGEKRPRKLRDQVDRLPAWLSGSCLLLFTHSSRRIGCGPTLTAVAVASVDCSPSSPAMPFRCADLVDFISTRRTVRYRAIFWMRWLANRSAIFSDGTGGVMCVRARLSAEWTRISVSAANRLVDITVSVLHTTVFTLLGLGFTHLGDRTNEPDGTSIGGSAVAVAAICRLFILSSASVLFRLFTTIVSRCANKSAMAFASRKGWRSRRSPREITPSDT